MGSIRPTESLLNKSQQVLETIIMNLGGRQNSSLPLLVSGYWVLMVQADTLLSVCPFNNEIVYSKVYLVLWP